MSYSLGDPIFYELITHTRSRFHIRIRINEVRKSSPKCNDWKGELGKLLVGDNFWLSFQCVDLWTYLIASGAMWSSIAHSSYSLLTCCGKFFWSSGALAWYRVPRGVLSGGTILDLLPIAVIMSLGIDWAWALMPRQKTLNRIIHVFIYDSFSFVFL